MNVNIVKNIQSGLYSEVRQLVGAPLQWNDELLSLAFDTGSLGIYVYNCFLILENETPVRHERAAAVMNAALVYYNGYSCGIMHNRRMTRLEPDNVLYLSHLLYDNHIPDHLVGDNEAYQISLKILSIDPLHKFAKEKKERIENRRLHNVPESKQYMPQDDEYPEFVKLVHTGFYEEAKALLKDYALNDIEKLLCMLMERHNSVAFYTYAFFMLLDQETVQGHLLAGKLLLLLKEVFGADSGALFHARRALELEPQSLTSLEFFLSFYDLPGSLIADAEAMSCARQILAIDPIHENASEVLKKLSSC